MKSPGLLPALEPACFPPLALPPPPAAGRGIEQKLVEASNRILLYGKGQRQGQPGSAAHEAGVCPMPLSRPPSQQHVTTQRCEVSFAREILSAVAYCTSCRVVSQVHDATADKTPVAEHTFQDYVVTACFPSPGPPTPLSHAIPGRLAAAESQWPRAVPVDYMVTATHTTQSC